MRLLLGGAGRSRLRDVQAVLASLLCLAILPLVGCSGDDQGSGATRVLVLGDSLSQGRSGDWTWRYRLWQHLEAVGADVDFVGPRRGVPVTGQVGATWPESSLYVDPEFDSEHAARWGQSATWLETPPDELVEDYQPDVVVLALGTNDLAFAHRTPQQTVDMLGAVIENLRAADPDVDVVAMQLPVTEQAGSAATNELLDSAVRSWDERDSRVVLARADRYYGPAATWDGVHPNATGDWALARPVAEALAVLGVGETMPAPTTDEVAAAERRQITAPSLSVSTSQGEAYLRWTATAWADGYRVWVRDVTAGQVEMVEHGKVEGTAERVSGLVSGNEYEFAVEPLRGDTDGGALSRSPAVRAVPAAPMVATGPITPTVAGSEGAVALTWAPAPGASGYRVWYRRTGEGASGWRTVEASGPGADVPGLVVGATYGFMVQPVLGDGAVGAPGPEVSLTVPGVTPAPVTPSWRTTEVSGTVVFSWPEQPGVGWYEVSVRNVTRSGPWESSVSGTFLPRPRVTLLDAVVGETYEFRVTPVNGVLRGPEGAVTLTVPEPGGEDGN